MNSRINTVARTTCIGVVLSVAALYAVGCSRATPQLSPVNGESDATRRLEVDVSVSMPPGARFTYVLREIGNRVDGYVVDELNHDKREPLSPSPAMRRFIDRVDSLIVYRAPGDTNPPLAPNQIELCGDGFSYHAQVTTGSIRRTVGVASCGDRSPGRHPRSIVP